MFRLLMDRGYPGLLARWRGEEVTLSLIKGEIMPAVCYKLIANGSRYLVRTLGQRSPQAVPRSLRAVSLFKLGLLPPGPLP